MKNCNIINKNTDYGQVKFLLKERMYEKNIDIEALSIKSKIDSRVIENYYYNKVNTIDLETLTKLCNILDCNIKDIMHYHQK